MRHYGLRILDLGTFALDQILRNQRVGTLVTVMSIDGLAVLCKRDLRLDR